MASTSQGSEIIETNFSETQLQNSSTENKDESISQPKIPKIGQCNKTYISSELQNGNEVAIEELLGSVTTFNNVSGGSEKALRTSARVIKKLKQDSLVTVNTEKDKKETKSGEKPDKPKVKPPKAPWSVIEKNLFFEALNEFGKDFEPITQYISSKMRRRGVSDNLIKTKDQVRHFYYRTSNKISKFITFNSSLKKVAQELYVLINYGEMRKKIFLINDKTALKLSELIYRGSVPLRIKGKTIRIKTPMCKALRRINQMEEWQDELKLPTRVSVVLQPSTSEAWHRVQSVAHNPRVTAMMPVQRRLSNLLKILNDRWKTYDTKLLRKLTDIDKKSVDLVQSTATQEILHFGPRVGVHINKPIINLSEYITSNRICLNSYEDRLGITEKSETIFARTIQNFKGGGSKKGAKRPRSDSGGDKKTQDPECDGKRVKIESETSEIKPTDVESAVKLEMTDMTAVVEIQKDITNVLIKQENRKTTKETIIDNVGNKNVPEIKIEAIPGPSNQKAEVKSKTKEKGKIVRKRPKRKAIDKERESKMEQRFKHGWTLEDAADVTFGDLYLMFGAESKLQMEYWWDHVKKSETNPDSVKSDSQILKEEKALTKDGAKTSKDQNENISKKTGDTIEKAETHLILPYKTEVLSKPDPPSNSRKPDKILQTTEITRRLKQLLLCLKVNESNKKSSCSCGHTCSDKSASGSKYSVKRLNTTVTTDAPNEPLVQTYISQRSMNPILRDNAIFRPPLPISSKAVDNFEKQINSLMKIKPRWNNRRGRTVRTKQVVQRMLPLLPKSSNSGFMNMSYSNVDMVFKGPGYPRIIAPRQLNFGPDAPHNAHRTPELIRHISSEPVTVTTCNPVIIFNQDLKPGMSKPNFAHIKQVTSTITSADVKAMEAKETSNISDRKQDDDILETNSINLEDISIGSSTIAEAQATIIRTDNFEELLDQNPSTSTSPSRLLNTSDNSWYNSDLHDFSLSSFLGHLESPVKLQSNVLNEEVKISQDVDVNMQSLINENSVDYMAKFAALAAQMSNENVNK